MGTIDDILGTSFEEIISNIRAEPLNIEYLHQLVDYLFFDGDLERMKEVLENILQIDEENSLAYLRLADIYRLSDNEELFEKCLQLSVKYAQDHEAHPHLELGQFYIDQEEFALAVAQYEIAYMKSPSLDTRGHLGFAYLRNGQFEDAKVLLEATYNETKALCETGENERLSFTIAADSLIELYQKIGEPLLAETITQVLRDSPYNFNKIILD